MDDISSVQAPFLSASTESDTLDDIQNAWLDISLDRELIQSVSEISDPLPEVFATTEFHTLPDHTHSSSSISDLPITADTEIVAFHPTHFASVYLEDLSISASVWHTVPTLFLPETAPPIESTVSYQLEGPLSSSSVFLFQPGDEIDCSVFGLHFFQNPSSEALITTSEPVIASVDFFAGTNYNSVEASISALTDGYLAIQASELKRDAILKMI